MTAGLRLGVIDDHPAISAGVAYGLAGAMGEPVACIEAMSVADLIATGEEFGIVLLDVRLADGSEPAANVAALVERGWPVVLFTQERRPAIVGKCLQAGALGVVGKHEDWPVLAQAVRDVTRGLNFLNADWACAAESLLRCVPELAPREAEVLRLYAAGLPMKSVALRVAISEDTAKEYLHRLREKYTRAGRPAPTKTDLLVRAVEDGHLDWPGQG